MRQLREFPEEDAARLLCDALLESGIEVELIQSQSGGHAVWVIDEAQLGRAQSLAEEWLDRGESSALQDAAKRGRAARELNERIQERRERQRKAVEQRMAQLIRPRPTPLTWGLIALCVAVAALTKLGGDRELIAPLIIVDPRTTIAIRAISLGGMELTWLGLPWHEPWRVITPVLVHFDLLHIFFNMLMLRDLGRVIEAQHGSRFLAIFVVVSGAISNIAQFEIAKSPMFAGMSGVVYGLLGMIWLRGKLDPRAGYGLSRGTVQFMLIWLLLGFFPQFHVANWCHVFGLLVGLAWAYVGAKLAR
jgi:GlpG protein